MVESNGVEHPADGRTEEGTRTASIGFTGAWGITAAFAVLLGILGVASWTTNEATKASEWVAHTYQVEENLRKMLSVLQDAETGQRGYLLTGDDAYLEPFVLANDRIDDIVADLRVLTGDNPRQQEAIDRLEPLIADKLDELKQTISLRQAKRAEEALAIVRSDRGKLIMDRIRVLIAEMESVEAALLVVRQGNLEWVTTLNIYGEGIGLIFLIGIAAIVIFKINHTLTFRRRAEADLRKSEARYRTLASVVPVGIFHTDAQGRVTYVNEKWCEIGGMTSEEAMGAGWLAAVHPEDRESIAAKWDAFASNQSAYLAEYRYRRQDGVVAYCYVQALPETDRAGKLIGYVGSVTDITERKRAEEALRESEQSLANAQRIAHMGSWDWNIVTNEMLWSDETYRIYGLEPPEFGATHDLFMDAVHPDDRMLVYDAVDKTIASHELYSIEFRLLRPDGAVRFVHERGEVIYGDDGAPLRMNGTVHDLTERKQAEEALHESEARYREIFDESPVGVREDDWSDVKRMLDDLVAGGVTDLREYFNDNPNKFNEAINLSKIVEISRATIELYGAPNKQALIELDRAELKSDEELDGFMGSIIAFMAGETEFEFESVGQRLDGTPMVTTSRLVMPPQHRHDWSRVIYATEDITERKRAEKERQASAQRLEDIANAASDWFWEMDADLRFTYISDRYEEVAGLAPDHFYGKRMDETYPRSVARDPEIWQSFLDAVRERKDFRDFVHDDFRQDGLRRVISNTGKAIFDEYGVFQGYRGTSTDITERKQAEEALSTLNEELEQRVEDRTAALLAARDELVRKERLATLGQLTAMVSHELRNPLGAMRASVAVIKKLASGEPPMLREAVEITDRSITRCDGIISDLLDYTRAQPLDLQVMAFDDWVAGILDEYVLPDNVAMHRDLRSGAEIRFDCDRLRRTLVNLLDNACQAMGEGWEGESSITVGTDISGERLRLSVRDTGPGIAPDQLDKVFEPLFSTKSFGIGLGLSIVKQIAEQHGGGIDIDSEPDRGAAFVLWLPLTGKEERAA